MHDATLGVTSAYFFLQNLLFVLADFFGSFFYASMA